MWIRADGGAMTEEDWKDPTGHSLGMLMFGRAADEVDERGRMVRGDTLLLLLNAGPASKSFSLPKLETPGLWEELLNTSRSGRRIIKAAAVHLAAHSTILLRRNEDLRS
jgi:glycogen operon protein